MNPRDLLYEKDRKKEKSLGCGGVFAMNLNNEVEEAVLSFQMPKCDVTIHLRQKVCRIPIVTLTDKLANSIQEIHSSAPILICEASIKT